MAASTGEETHDPVPLILEDITGDISKSEFIDVYNRRHFTYAPLIDSRNDVRIEEMALDAADHFKSVEIKWGKEYPDEGTVYYSNQRRSVTRKEMKEYLPVIDPDTHSVYSLECASRSFTSVVDRKVYNWMYHPPSNLEMQWECVDPEGETAAYYSLKLPGEPAYVRSSGCSLTICKGYEKLTMEILATCMIVRTAQKFYHQLAQERRAQDARARQLQKEVAAAAANEDI